MQKGSNSAVVTRSNCTRLNPLALIQGKRREHRPSNGNQRRAPSGGGQGGPAVESIGTTPMAETLQFHRLQSVWPLAGYSERGGCVQSGVWKQR